MQTVTDTPRIYKPVAKRATLYTDITLTHATTGVALRMPDGHVYFNDDATGRWIELVDADLPRVILHGQADLILSAGVADGNLVVRTSKTLQHVTA